jgi:hypothetical protein
MAHVSFDDPGLVAAMTAFVEATMSVEAATEDVEILQLADSKAFAGMVLRKRLIELGWSAPVSQRSTT